MLHALDRERAQVPNMSSFLPAGTELEQDLDLELVRHISYETELQEVIKESVRSRRVKHYVVSFHADP